MTTSSLAIADLLVKVRKYRYEIQIFAWLCPPETYEVVLHTRRGGSGVAALPERGGKGANPPISMNVLRNNEITERFTSTFRFYPAIFLPLIMRSPAIRANIVTVLRLRGK